MDAAADLKQRPSKAASFIHIHTRVTDYSSVPVMAHAGVKMDFRQSWNVNLLSYRKCLFILMTFSSLYVQITHAATICIWYIQYVTAKTTVILFHLVLQTVFPPRSVLTGSNWILGTLINNMFVLLKIKNLNSFLMVFFFFYLIDWGLKNNNYRSSCITIRSKITWKWKDWISQNPLQFNHIK